jgi:hypothetical protein
MEPMVERQRLIGTARGGVKGVDSLLGREFGRRALLCARLFGGALLGRRLAGVLGGDIYVGGRRECGSFGPIIPRKGERPEGHQAEHRGRYDSSSSHPAFFVRS